MQHSQATSNLMKSGICCHGHNAKCPLFRTPIQVLSTLQSKVLIVQHIQRKSSRKSYLMSRSRSAVMFIVNFLAYSYQFKSLGLAVHAMIYTQTTHTFYDKNSVQSRVWLSSKFFKSLHYIDCLTMLMNCYKKILSHPCHAYRPRDLYYVYILPWKNCGQGCYQTTKPKSF